MSDLNNSTNDVINKNEKKDIIQWVILLCAMCLYCSYFMSSTFGIAGSLKRYRVTAEMTGGLGQQLYVVAAAYTYMKKTNGRSLQIGRMGDSDIALNTNYYDNIFSRIGKIKTMYKQGRKRISGYNFNKDYRYNTIIYVDGNDPFISYFRDLKYFSGYKQDIIKLYSPSSTMNDKINKNFSELGLRPNDNNLLAVHILYDSGVVENDYEIYTNDELKRLGKLIDELKSNYKILIFSNDQNKSRKLFLNNYYSSYVDYEEFYMLSRCNYVIASPGSVCWWALYMNPNLRRVWIIWTRSYNQRKLNTLYTMFPIQNVN